MVPPGSYLPFTKRELIDRLLAHQPASVDRIHLEACLQLASHLINAFAADTLDQLKENFAYFDPTSPTSPDASDEEFDRRERLFLSDLLSTLVRGNFMPLSEKLYQKAIDQRFVLDTPLTVQWKRLDNAPIKRFMNYADSETGQSLRDQLGISDSLRSFIQFPEAFEERALVFHRGLSPFRTDGWYIPAKLDLIVSRIVGVLTYPVVRLVEFFFPRPPVKEEAVNPHGPNAARRRWVRRLGLENMPFSGMFSKSRFQEPAFREIVVVFRLFSESARSPIERIFKKKEAPVQNRRLQIKIFRDIPLADAEIVFPDNAPRIRTLDLVKLIVTAIVAAPAVVRALTGGGSASLVAAVVLCAYVSKVVGQYLRARAMRLARMTKELYHKTRDNDLGVLQYLVDASEEQDYKEVALVYAILLAEGVAMTAEEADDRIESFLHEKFAGLDVDFEIDDAIRKATGSEHSMDLLEVITDKDGQTRYRARPPEIVFKDLRVSWNEFVERIRPAQSSPTEAISSPKVGTP